MKHKAFCSTFWQMAEKNPTLRLLHWNTKDSL